jgi:hypothetical protein
MSRYRSICRIDCPAIRCIDHARAKPVHALLPTLDEQTAAAGSQRMKVRAHASLDFVWHDECRIQFPIDGVETVPGSHFVHSPCAFSSQRRRVRRQDDIFQSE